MHTDSPNDPALEQVIIPRTRDLGDNFEVRRALPTVERRMVGPFVFLDQMGPNVLSAGHGLDVRPHPHICLATVTYLMEGEIQHRDSLGTVQRIRPGEVNWMTAGSGIVHSERTPQDMRGQASRLFGLQCWVALPRAHEETAPGFVHVDAPALPVMEDGGARATLVAGSLLGKTSPVPVMSPMCYVDIVLERGACFVAPAEYDEQALYVTSGRIDLGADGQFDAGQLLVLKPGRQVRISAANAQPARVMLLGGEPMDGPRYLTWNFVASSAERIEQAKQDWKNRKFPEVPGETEFIPLPDLPGKPVAYP